MLRKESVIASVSLSFKRRAQVGELVHLFGWTPAFSPIIYTSLGVIPCLMFWKTFLTFKIFRSNYQRTFTHWFWYEGKKSFWNKESDGIWDLNMVNIGINLKFTANVVLVLINVTGINAESSGGFRGKVVEKIGKSRHKTVRSIELKGTDQLKVDILSTWIHKTVLLRERKRHTDRRVASPWRGGAGTYLGRGEGHIPCPGEGIPTFARGQRGYLPWPEGRGTYRGRDGVPPQLWTDWNHYLPPSFGSGR